MADEVLCSIQDGIATLTLNRPEKRNAINSAMMASLATHFHALEQHRDVRVVVLRGVGKVFAPGVTCARWANNRALRGWPKQA